MSHAWSLRRFASLLVVAAGTAALGSTSFAQDQPHPTKDGKPEKGAPRLPKVGETPPTPSAPEKPAPDKPAPEKSEPELLVETLGTWPSQEARQAAIRLRAQPSISYPLLEARMVAKDQDWRMIAGAAATLGMIGDLRAVDLIQAKLQDGRMYQHASDLLDALVRIDQVGAKRRLMSLLLHPASAVVLEVEKRLQPRVAPTDVQDLRDEYEAAGPVARAALLRLMGQADRAASRPDEVKALRDANAEVALAAAQSLATDEAPESLEMTRKALVSAVDRQVAYAMVSLAMRSERGGARVLDDATVQTLSSGRGLKSLDRLTRTSAALLLADEAFFHEVPVLDDALDREVMPALVDAWVSREFWPDMRSMLPLVLRRLRRLTGRLDLESPLQWASWWEEERAKFHAQRVLCEVPPELASALVVTVGGPGAPGGETTAIVGSGENLTGTATEDLVLLVAPADAVLLAKALSESGFLSAQESSSAGADAPTAVAVTARLGRRERRAVLRADSAEPRVAHLLATITDLRTRLAWQRYRSATSGQEAATLVGAMAAAFAPERDENERAAAFATLVVNAIDERRGTAFNLRALKDLENLPKLPTALTPESSDRLLSLLAQRKELDETAAGIVRVLARSRRPETTPLVLSFLVVHDGATARELAAFVLRNVPNDRLVAALSDEKPQVRLAAFGALQKDTVSPDAMRRIEMALEDTDRLVAAEALRALGRIGSETSRPLLEAKARDPGDLRTAALEALGSLGGTESLPTIMTAYASDDTGLRVAAVRGLAATREPSAVSLVVFAMNSDPSSLVRDVANRAVLEMGNDRVATELRKLALDPAQPVASRIRAVAGLATMRGKDASPDLVHLLEDPTDEVADEAAVALSRWREPAAVPHLVAMLDKERSVPRARQALESISLESFAQRDAKLLADLYGGWWQLSKERSPKLWLLDVLTLDGREDPALREWAEGRAAREAVPSLLVALRSDKWYVRRAADLALRDLLAKNLGDEEPYSTPGEVARIAQGWEKVWAATLTK